MRVIVFGATGGTGSEVVSRALAARHEVTAFVRDPSVAKFDSRVRLQPGDATDAQSVAAAIAGQDAVVCAIGPRRGTPAGTLISTAVSNILTGMKAHGVRRFVYESGRMVGTGKGLKLPFAVGLALYRRMNHALYLDKVRAEKAIRGTDLDWVILRPPTLVHQPGTGKYRVGEDLDVSLNKNVPHGDVADFMVKLLEGPTWVRRTVDISL